ncbi:hypothetical protein M413DRAFT_446801 [Hebeloma cylindrosporum]|uniref:Uncharacterized protein n=1 Tax=Hebeloma cylindrosporum TaxID=76867 RepID=A0A0C3C8G2_HEBCY|nr:hypothetical protein M413DRAFT_446801 [Hebeloma cylindrosporum h7]
MSGEQLVKRTASSARVKLLYERVTLTRFTALYFFCAIVTCILLSSLQVVSLAHDLRAVSALSSLIQGSNITGLAIRESYMGVPILDGEMSEDITSRDDEDGSGDDEDDDDDDDKGKGKGKSKGKGPGENDNIPLPKEPDTIPSPRTSPLVRTAPTPSVPPTLPVPKTSSPVPQTSSPVPQTSSPVPQTSSSVPQTSSPAPQTSSPAPQTSSPAPQTSSPAPQTSSPVPQTSSPISHTSSPVPQTSSPVPQISTPLPPASKTVQITPVVNPPFPPSVTSQTSVLSSPGPSVTPMDDQNSWVPEEACITSLVWLKDILHDSLREDVVTLVFQVWLFILALVTVINQSIPHLGAGLLGQALGTSWRAYRVHFINILRDEYHQDVLRRACNNQEFLGGWLEKRIEDAIPLVALNSLALVLLGYFSYKLLNEYSNQTFRRVGASPSVQRLYKFVLAFSLCLQVSGFFSLASVTMWIDKASRPHHGKFYLASSIVTLVLLFPWLIIGWIGVRRESRMGFVIFFIVSLIIIGISTSMFSSNLYRYTFSSWTFFATITVTALIFLIATTALGIVCRISFGQGLAHYLQVSEALEEADFTPADFDTGQHGGDPEKPRHEDVEDFSFRLPVPVHSAPHTPQTKAIRDESRFTRNSVYSDNDRPPIQLSSSAPLESELASVKRLSTSSRFSRALKKFSMFAPSVSAKSVWREQDNQSSSGSAPASIKSSPRLSRNLDPFAAISPPLPSPPALSYVASNLSYASSNAANSAVESQSSNPFVQRIYRAAP